MFLTFLTLISCLNDIGAAPLPHTLSQKQSLLAAPDYLAVSIAAYEAGIHDSRHHINITGEKVDTWALPAALIAKHLKNTTWAERSRLDMESFVASWVTQSANGTLPWARSGFTAWTVPWAYAILRDLGWTPPWTPAFLHTFQQACDAWMNPVLSGIGEGADGIEELGNWNKGFQHCADAAAMLRAFPEIDACPKNAGVYKRYLDRCWTSGATQHVYPENSANYNAISMQIIVNVLPRLAGHPKDASNEDVLKMGRRYASLFDCAGCMPAFGASNTFCETPLLMMSAFEGLAAMLKLSHLSH